MESDVREALRHLTTAFENHLEAVILRRGPIDAAVDDSYEALAEAFERYEDLLDSEYAEELPLVLEDEMGDDGAEADLDDGDLDDLEEGEIDDDVDILADDADEPEIEDIDEFDLRD